MFVLRVERLNVVWRWGFVAFGAEWRFRIEELRMFVLKSTLTTSCSLQA